MAAKKTPSFEDRLRRLQEVVAALENGELPLEDSVRLYKEGLTLSRSCREQLEKARNEVRLLTGEGLEPFDEKKLDEEGEEEPEKKPFAAGTPRSIFPFVPCEADAGKTFCVGPVSRCLRKDR